MATDSHDRGTDRFRGDEEEYVRELKRPEEAGLRIFRIFFMQMLDNQGIELASREIGGFEMDGVMLRSIITCLEFQAE